MKKLINENNIEKNCKLEDDKFNINSLFFKLKIISEIKEN